MAGQIAELFATLGFRVDDQGVKDFKSGIGKAKDAVLSLKGAIAAAGIVFLGKQAIDAAVDLDKMQEQTGASALQLQRLKVLAKDSGVSVGSLAAAMEKANKGEPISPKAAALIEKSRHSLKGFNEELFLTNKEKKGMVKLAKTMSKIKQELAFVIQKIVAKLAPALKKIVDFASKLAKWFMQIFDAIDQIVESTIGWEKLIIGLAVAFGVLALAARPISIIIAGILLIIEDISVYMRGGTSVFGSIINWFKKIGSIIKKEIIDPIMNAFNKITGGISGIKSFLGITDDTQEEKEEKVRRKKEISGKIVGASKQFGEGSILGGVQTLFGSPTPQASGAGSNQTNNVNINVSSLSDDPKAVASEVKSAFDQEKENADYQLNNSGV